VLGEVEQCAFACEGNRLLSFAQTITCVTGFFQGIANVVSYHIRNVPVSATIEMSRCGFHQAVEKIGVFIC
jgi:hypothetical protein